MPTTTVTFYAPIRPDSQGRRCVSLPTDLSKQEINTDAAPQDRRAFCRSLRLLLLGAVGLHGQICIDDLPQVGKWGVEESHGFAAVTVVLQHGGKPAAPEKQAIDAIVKAMADAGRTGLNTAEILAQVVSGCLMAESYEPHHVGGIEYAEKVEQYMLERG